MKQQQQFVVVLLLVVVLVALYVFLGARRMYQQQQKQQQQLKEGYEGGEERRLWRLAKGEKKLLVSSLKIKIGVWVHKDNLSMYQFVQQLKRFVPLEIVPYGNKFQPFYELNRRNVDLIFTNEKDYMIYWLNKQTKGGRGPEMQVIAYGYFLYVCMVANYHTMVRAEDMNNGVIALGPKEELGHDYEKSMVRQYAAHLTYRNKDNLAKDLEQVGKGETDVMFVLSSHPNKIILDHSNQHEIYLMSLRDANLLRDDIYDQYLFLHKKKLDLSYYPKMFQRYNARNRMDSLEVNTSPLMDVFAVKTLFMGLETLNTPYIYEFTKAYFKNIFDAVADKAYLNNFNELDVSISRLTGPNGILHVHDGTRQFMTQIGNYTRNPAKNCALLQNACRPDQLAAYGDYAMALF